MADDLDELLDEVENKFCRLSRRDCSERGRPGQGQKRNRFREEEEEAEAEAAAAGERARFSNVLTKGASEEEDIDDIIQDIIDENSYAKNLVKPKSKSPSPAYENKTTSVQAHGKRCCPVYLGGSSSPHGIGTNISQRTCDQLRCTACDFCVLQYDDFQWDQSCDYLFFRNNMPEFRKLRTKMLTKKGSRAYACQCTWRSIDELTELTGDRQLRWVCSKHVE
ncbi:cilia- and flagella-associated protein 418 isoform X1 [Zootoca vivipara]|uniref:cilia- and flagella-associated protein 418 isoform X1 n=1 Tax=Zootoca vivipara TaxID=8524 RepID=UPI00159022E2|nr:cilia- and flagella-associated protein 418 isoform X1 [Zootoca vivipara]